MTQRIDCVGIICLRGDDVLLIKRGQPPRQGEWSIPGGRIEPGESQKQAALREVAEETGVTASSFDKVCIIDATFEGRDYRLHDYVAIWESGEPRADDDAEAAVFMPLSRISALKMWHKTEDVIHESMAIVRSRTRS